MDLRLLKPGHKIRMHDGSEAEVLTETEDGEWIKVRYLDNEHDPLFVGTEDLVSSEEVEALLGVAAKRSWGDKVTVILHYSPESEESEQGYEVVTIVGVPHNVSITSEDSDSAEAALKRLLNALRTFGFRGRVSVEDATVPGHMEWYEVDVGAG